jgi:putative DNA methylase
MDFPIAEVSKHAVREKSIRSGHPSGLHLWWARRPLASSRAILLALLLPDPCDPLCPKDFKESARELLPRLQGSVGVSDGDLRAALLKFIGGFANWDLATSPPHLEVSRALVRAAHGDEPPLVVDPFAGGGSIPLEALRLGCEAFASDLNPVACLILKTMLEDIPRHGPSLADDLRRAGAEIRAAAGREVGHLYPWDQDGARPIAYLWARTVRCEAPNCGAEIPLMRSFWLCKKSNRRFALRHHVVQLAGEAPRVEFEVFEPRSQAEVRVGTVARAKATCLCCGSVLPPERVRAQLAAQHGGADVLFNNNERRIGGARMIAVATLRPGASGRHYRLPMERDYSPVRTAQLAIQSVLDEWDRVERPGLCPVPNEPLPPVGALGFRVQRYGMVQWGDLFAARQKMALLTLARAISGHMAPAATSHLVALALGKTTDLCNSGAPWKPDAECPVHMLSSQKIPPFWDWAEPAIYEDSSGSFKSAYDRTADALAEAFSFPYAPGTVSSADAADYGILPDQSAGVWFTDPPYYDAVPYADLSDFFLVWLKRALPDDLLLRDPFDSLNVLSPKRQEAVQDESEQDNGRAKDRAWFEEKMALAFTEGRRVLRDDGVGAVVFAHKTTEGWEALLSGMIRGGWTITGSWPIATEMTTRLRARDSAALATSVHLICRPRSEDARVGDWADVLRELPRRVGNWMERLQGEGVRGADLVFACIGPALEVFSQYRSVETADGREVPLAEYLPKVWEVVGRIALETVLGTAEARARNGAAGALEEDARLTALFLWTLQSTNGDELEADPGAEDEGPNDEDLDDEADAPAGGRRKKGLTLVHDVVRRFAQPLGIDLSRWEGRVIDTKKGVVRLLPVAERATQLFGQDGAAAVASRLEQETARGGAVQLQLFIETEAAAAPSIRGRRRSGTASDDDLKTSGQATTLDRVHAAMLLQAGGRTNALRALLASEQDRSPDFLRLANALSALYPKASEEKRLLDAMLLAVPR